MTSSAHKQLSILHKSLYERAYKEAHSFLSESNPQIKKYASDFEEALPNDFIRAGLKDLLEAFRAPSLVLYGDFHTLKQSQKGLVRMLRAYIERSGKTNVVIAMEAFRASDQPAIDDFLTDKISEEAFLKKTKYLNHWGFPWAHYKLILECAKEHAIKVMGINSRNGGKDHLAFRDQFAARKLVSAAKENPKSIVLCMIGESHLADDHLPKYLAEELTRRETSMPVVRVLTNVDKYFFKLQAMSPHLTTEYLKLKENLFCIINSPPWMKWQSYAIWEEMRGLQGHALLEGDLNDDSDDHDYTEEGYDLDYQLLTLVKNLVAFLDLNISESDLSKFHIHFSPELDFESDIEEENITNQQELKAILERVSLDGLFFLPNTRKVLLSDLSINNTAEAASQLLFGFLSRFEPRSKSADDIFFGRCLRFAAGMLGSKILNPRRKCPDLTGFSIFVKDNTRKHLIGHAKQKREAARSVLALHEWLAACALTSGDRSDDVSLKGARTFVDFDRRNDFELSRSVGNMLGQRIYKKTMAGQLPSHSIKSFFQASTEHESPWKTFLRFYTQAFLK